MKFDIFVVFCMIVGISISKLSSKGLTVYLPWMFDSVYHKKLYFLMRFSPSFRILLIPEIKFNYSIFPLYLTHKPALVFLCNSVTPNKIFICAIKNNFVYSILRKERDRIKYFVYIKFTACVFVYIICRLRRLPILLFSLVFVTDTQRNFENWCFEINVHKSNGPQ